MTEEDAKYQKNNQVTTDTNNVVSERKFFKSGEILRSNKENSTFYGEDSKPVHRVNKTTVNFSSSLHRKPKNQSLFCSTTMSQNINNARYPGMSEFHSTNSLQNSSYIWSFTKSNRFAGGVYTRPTSDNFYNLPSSISGRYTTQGFGNKYDLRPLQGRESPPPNTYRIKSMFSINKEKKKGVSIHEKVPGLPHPASKYPGPGTYNVRKDKLGLTHGSPVTIKSRTMFFYDEDIAKAKHCVSPQKYLPSTKIVENLRYTRIGFGIGGRSANENTRKSIFYFFIFLDNLKVPGPGAYNLPSVFDKTRKYRVPLN